MRIEEIWFGEGIAMKLARVALLPLAGVYALGAGAYRGMYALGLKRAKKPHAKIVCIGNLTVGGSGKSPVTAFVAQTLMDAGFEVVLGCSGYGSPRSEAATLAPPGELDAATWGDEPAEFRELFPTLPIIVGRRRVLAAEICAGEYPNAVLLMDDGFQHLPLSKDVTIVLDDPSATPNRFPFPAGPFREVRALVKPNLFLPSEKFRIEYSTLDLPENLSQVNVLTAIGRPDLFLDSVSKAGVEIVERRVLPDHDPLSREELFACQNSLPWVVTAKDWVKLRKRKDISAVSIFVARRSATIQPHQDFVKWLTIKLQ